MMFVAADRGEKVLFEKPFWANTYTEDDLKYRPHANGITAHADGGEIVEVDESKNQLPNFSAIDSGYWWIELGGDYEDIIEQGEEIRDDLMKSIYGIWDHLKNTGDHGAQNLDLEWVGMVPGYRESRRLDGDYILTENDIRANRVFEDAVAYGGWPMDNHCRGGLKDGDDYPSHMFNYEGCYTIPYRCYCSKNIENLMMAGRDISTSKMAFSSIRVMATCAVGGQAVGTAAAMAIKKKCSPKEIGKKHIHELQQQLLKDDCYIPSFKNMDENDLAKVAKVSATSEKEGSYATNVVNGVARTVGENTNCWESETIGENGETLTLSLEKTTNVHQLRVTFDSNLSREIMPSLTKIVRERQVKGMPYELVKDYRIILLLDGNVVWEKDITNNTQRLNVHELDGVECDTVQITVKATHGWEGARIYEVRIY